MNLLVTAGNTQVMIDQVRCITNIFTGRTGAAIALEAHNRGHRVTLLTSHPEAHAAPSGEHWRLQKYATYEELAHHMEAHVKDGGYDAVVHSAGVSDYLLEGVYEEKGVRTLSSAGKIKSDHPELWLRLVRAPKLIDRVRREWRFRGILVKFKLEVDIEDENLLKIAEKSRLDSQADFMVANTLAGASEWAYVGPFDAKYVRVQRPELAARIVGALENGR
jgi:phosphopantothenoylcysteine synthetase/decarboxylase